MLDFVFSTKEKDILWETNGTDVIKVELNASRIPVFIEK